MNKHDQEKLLKAILPAEDAADFRDASLAHGLAGLRRERRRRQVARFSVVATVLLGMGAGIYFGSRNATQPERVTSHVLPPSPASLASSHVEFISDDELLAVFTNQPVALIGKPGEQRLVFLGKSEANSAQPY